MMRLLDQIIDLAVDGTPGQIPILLRKCLLLARQLKNDRLRIWVEKELDGYSIDDELPEYRYTLGTARGYLVGPFGASISNQPLPEFVLKKEHRHWAREIKLRQPISAYEQSRQAAGNPVIMWPADLVAFYQYDFIEGYALNRAWLEIPSPFLASLLDTVCNRVLRFALDLKDDLGEVGDKIEALPPDKVDNQVVYNIYGGTNVVATSAKNFTQVGAVSVGEGDVEGLRAALKKLGASEGDVSDLQTALAADTGAASSPALGQRTKAWLGRIGGKIAEAGVNVSIDTAKAEAAKYLFQYLGLS